MGILEERPLILEYDAPFWRTHEPQHLYEKLDRDLGEANWGLLFDRARWSKSFLVLGSILLIFSSLANSTALGQESLGSTAFDGAFLDTPQPAQTTTPSGANDSPQTATGSLSGTALDTNRNVLQGARVTLANPSGSVIRTLESGSNGQFAFTGLPPDIYKLTVTGPGMSTFTSTQISLRAGEDLIVPTVTLSVAGGTTSVTVTSGSKQELAQEQVRIAVQQRIRCMGVVATKYPQVGNGIDFIDMAPDDRLKLNEYIKECDMESKDGF